MAKTKLTMEKQVAHYLDNLQHPLVDVVKELKKIILEADKEIDEQIKWNSLAYFYTGDMLPFDPKEYKLYTNIFLKKISSAILFIKLQ